VPKAGVELAPAAYGDRRLQDVERVDYQQPGFAVVFANAKSAGTQASAALVLESHLGRTRFRPENAVTDLAGGVSIENASGKTRVVSVPAAGFARPLAAGETAHISPSEAGELEIHLLGERVAPAVVFVAPGPFARVGSDGRYELRGLAPGAVEIRAWHPRLPVSVGQRIQLTAGRALRLDLEIGVDRAGKHEP
ncbi:MAG: carboxypeptidase-like regulatory domain-containing protein, partial [Myxococcota bacterium]